MRWHGGLVIILHPEDMIVIGFDCPVEDNIGCLHWTTASHINHVDGCITEQVYECQTLMDVYLPSTFEIYLLTLSLRFCAFSLLNILGSSFPSSYMWALGICNLFLSYRWLTVLIN